jgi:hypothetical protein
MRLACCCRNLGMHSSLIVRAVATEDEEEIDIEEDAVSTGPNAVLWR